MIGELHYHLETYEDEAGERKYEKQAKFLMYRIPIYRPVPPYVISRKDLTAKLNQELKNYDAISRQDVLRDAVGRIFENINQRYFIQSVKRLLRVELKD